MKNKFKKMIEINWIFYFIIVLKYIDTRYDKYKPTKFFLMDIIPLAF